MDNFEQLHEQVTLRVLAAITAVSMIVTGVWLLCNRYLGLQEIYAAAASGGIGLVSAIILARAVTTFALSPLRFVQQAILHVDPDHQSVPAPNLDRVRLGRQLVTNLVYRVYQFASQQDSTDLIAHRKEIIQAANIVSHLPLPMFVFNKQLLVTNASTTALDYCGIESAQLFGKPIFDSLNLEFDTDNTLEQWIADCQANKVTDNGSWERVRVRLKDGATVRQCDISAFYNRENPSGADFIVTLFDRTTEYNQDDESLSFVALAVHELRTPLTMLRGYIEIFEEELSDKLDDEMRDFMLKMEAAADQLTSFVHNILNVARIDNNQLSLHLVEETWETIIQEAASDIQLRATIHGKNLQLDIDKDLPTVAVDKTSILEVLNNFVDNAIKYSPDSKDIIIKSRLTKSNRVETTVQDFGVGIPESVMPNLFTKFYRNHRTRGQIGGTGLGLYLCKALIDAHGGEIWAKSKEGQGSTFGFTVIPYSELSEELKSSGDSGITRQAHGWIKNHSYYRS